LLIGLFKEAMIEKRVQNAGSSKKIIGENLILTLKLEHFSVKNCYILPIYFIKEKVRENVVKEIRVVITSPFAV